MLDGLNVLMVILAAKLTDAHFKIINQKIGRIKISCHQDRRSYFGTKGLPGLLLSLKVFRANLIVALIISVFSFHLSNGVYFQVSNQPPSKYEVSLHLGFAS